MITINYLRIVQTNQSHQTINQVVLLVKVTKIFQIKRKLRIQNTNNKTTPKKIKKSSPSKNNKPSSIKKIKQSQYKWQWW